MYHERPKIKFLLVHGYLLSALCEMNRSNLHDEQATSGKKMNMGNTGDV